MKLSDIKKSIKKLPVPNMLNNSDLEAAFYHFNVSANSFDYLSPVFKNITGFSTDQLKQSGLKSIILQTAVEQLDGRSNILNDAGRSLVKERFSKLLIRTASGEKKWIESFQLIYQNSVSGDTEEFGLWKELSAGSSGSSGMQTGHPVHNIREVIIRILEHANRVENLSELFEHIHNALNDLFIVKNLYVALYNKSENMIYFPYFKDEIDKNAPPKRFGKGLTEYVLRTGKPQLIDKKTDEQLIQQGEVDLLGSQMAIWLGVPLKIDNDVIGVLVVQDYHDPYALTENELKILEIISYPVAGAIRRKQIDQEKNKLIEQLKEMNLSKDKLFSIISHDLRSPFNTLLGFSEILNTEYDTLTNEEKKEYLRVIYDSSKNLYEMTNNLLVFSRFQMGKIEVSPESVKVADIITFCINSLKANILKKDVTVIKDIPEDASILADKEMIKSVIHNLIGNAIKFSNQGGKIVLSASEISNQENLFPSVEIQIKDYGVGISSQNLEKINRYEMFTTPGTDREFGTGLGLIIAREFIQKNGGGFEIRSRLNKGTTVFIRLPKGE